MALLHKLEILMNLVWERLNTGHWAKVIASPLGRNTHWVLLCTLTPPFTFLRVDKLSHLYFLTKCCLKVWPGWRRLYALLAVARVRAIAQLVLVKGNGGRVLLRYNFALLS